MGHLLLAIDMWILSAFSARKGAPPALIVAFASIAASLSCAADPVREREMAALGGETPGVPHGPLHRPGQPCGLCHGADGPDTPEFSLAGTLYRTASSRTALPGATIHFIDATGEQHTTKSNCAGNFYVQKSEWTPSFPVWVKMELMDRTVEMTSAIFRETSCSACHFDPASPSSVGHMYFAEDESTLPEATCR